MESLNQELVDQMMLFCAFLTPIIAALIELVKRTSTTFPKNYLPLLSLCIGLVVGVISYSFTDLDVALRLWAGGIAGLSAVGLFEVTSKLLKSQQ